MNLLIATLVSLSVWLLFRTPSRKRLRRIVHQPSSKATTSLPMPLIAAVSLAIGVILLLGSAVGLLLGVISGVVVYRFFGKLESKSDRARTIALRAQLPMVCDLLSATLASGASIAAAMSAVSVAVSEPASATLHRVERALQLGTPASQVWSTPQAEPEFVRIAEAFLRSSESGAPIAELLVGVADDERRVKRSAVEVAARSAGVKAVMPLAACYLPAFILLGVVPVVASMATSLFE